MSQTIMATPLTKPLDPSIPTTDLGIMRMADAQITPNYVPPALPMAPPPRPSQAQFDAFHGRPGAQLTDQPPALSAATGRRDNAPLGMPKPMLSDQSIGMGEALMRIGGKGLSGAREGGLASMGAMFDQYGAIQDYNRSAALAEYNAAVAQQQAQAEAEQKALAQDSLDRYRRGLLATKIAKIQADQEKGKKGGDVIDAMAYTQPTITAIDSVLAKVQAAAADNNPFNNVTGMIGSIMSAVPGTPAHDVKMDIQTIQAAVGFDRLDAMRRASPTGGALGQVSERELSQLNASLGALEQSQSREQFITRMQAVKRHYMSTVRAIQNQQEAYNRGVRASGSSSAGDYSAEEQALLAAADKEVDGL